MDKAARLKSLSPAQQRLVKLMQEINFGRIENLSVRNGSPVSDPPPRIVREIKFAGENGPRAEHIAADFGLKSQVVDLIEQLQSMPDGVIECLFIKHGLPFSMSVAAAA